MRLGCPVFLDTMDFDLLAAEHRRLGLRAAYCPAVSLGDLPAVRAAEEAFRKADVVIAEVGAWVNPMDPDPEKAERAKAYVAERLALADEIGASTCVDILGSWNPQKWDGTDRRQYSQAFFDAAVETWRDIYDRVRPVRTTLSFETMPYYFLDNPYDYMRFLAAMDRPRLGVHLDLCNCMNDPRRYCDNRAFIQESFRVLGPRLVSLHLKDILLCDEGCTAIFREVPLGTGGMDIAAVLRGASAHPGDLPVMLEHLPDEESFRKARLFAQQTMRENGIEG